MNTFIQTGRENKTLDVFKFFASILIAATHLPSVFSSKIIDVYFCQWYFRFCVPFFFISTGFFYYKSKNKLLYLQRIFFLFALSVLLYLPKILTGSNTLTDMLHRLRWNLVIGYEHLWYLSAVFEGLLIWYFLEIIPLGKKLLWKFGVVISVILILLGALLDEHYHLINSQVLTAAGDFLLNFGGPRNVVFMGFPLMILGGATARWETKLHKIPLVVLILLWIFLRIFAFLECTYLLTEINENIAADLTFFGCWPALVLFLISFRFQMPISEGFAKLLRKLSEYIYILHPLVAEALGTCLALTPLELLISTIAFCCMLYILLEKQFLVKK